MGNKTKKRIANNPMVKRQAEKMAMEISKILSEQFEKVAADAEANKSEFKFEMNDEMKNALEEKGKEMSSFIKTMMDDKQKQALNKQSFKNHAVKVSIKNK